MRDSKDLLSDPNAPFPQIDLPADKWSTFLAEVLEQAPRGTNGSLFYEVQPTGHVALSSADSDVVLTYDNDEWVAFKGGVEDGDFGPITLPANHS